MRVIIFNSASLEALRDIQKILKDYFGVESRFKSPNHNESKCTYYHRLIVSGKKNIRKFLRQGLTSYRSSHEIIINELKDGLSRDKHGLRLRTHIKRNEKKSPNTL